MGTYAPATFPRRSKEKTLAGEIRYQVQLAYYRYEITTGLYVCNETEKLIFNLVMLSVLSLIMLSAYYYFPVSLQRSLRRVVSLLAGAGAKPTVSTIMSHQPQEAVASLVADGGSAVNTTTVIVSAIST